MGFVLLVVRFDRVRTTRNGEYEEESEAYSGLLEKKGVLLPMESPDHQNLAWKG